MNSFRATKPINFRENLTIHSGDTQEALPLRIAAGTWVEVRPLREILSTLDEEGKLDGVPFMPEMASFCGKRYRVSRRAEKVCTRSGARRLQGTVHLEDLRCDGSDHLNCQARCLLFWKEAWVRPVKDTGAHLVILRTQSGNSPSNVGIENGSLQESIGQSRGARSDKPLSCQATEIQSAGCPVPRENNRFLKWLYMELRNRSIRWSNLPELLIWLRGKVILSGISRWRQLTEASKQNQGTPTEHLNLCPGEIVEVKRVSEILPTLDAQGRNRGLSFKPEMFRFCGRRYRVLGRVQHRVDERTGLVNVMKNPCVILEAVHCQGMRLFCSRANYHYWREIWLRRHTAAL